MPSRSFWQLMPNKMKYFKTPHERKSAALTTIIAVLLLLLFSLVGLKYFDPPISYGMEVNFGTSTQGSGKVQPVKTVASQPKQVQQTTPKQTPSPVEESSAKVLKLHETYTRTEGPKSTLLSLVSASKTSFPHPFRGGFTMTTSQFFFRINVLASAPAEAIVKCKSGANGSESTILFFVNSQFLCTSGDISTNSMDSTRDFNSFAK